MSSAAIVSRHLRPFISSTFADMRAERDWLVNFTFPALRRRCEARGVVWSYVDLRWGISEERVAEGKVLPVCLNEIRRSHPVFLCILGERYGSYPDDLDEDLLLRERWLSRYRDRSVTELEILASALNPDVTGVNAFFYLRDPASADVSLPQHRGSAAAKLADLKRRIRGSGHRVRENFRSPEELGAWVQEDLETLLDVLFPLDETNLPGRLEAAEQEAFALSRTEGHVANREMFLQLDHHAVREDDSRVLMLHGAPGLGKTALLVNWALEFKRLYPAAFVFSHFIGAGERSARWQTVAQRLVRELQAAGGAEVSLPDTESALRREMLRSLERVAAERRVVVVIDALDQLENAPGAQDLAWLPRSFPANVRVVLSTVPGPPMEAGLARGWQLREVPPLDPKKDEVRAVARRYLEIYGKHEGPTAAQWDQIASAPQNTNALFLFTVLEEIRHWGQPETLGAALDEYLPAAGPVELFEKVLRRYQVQYESPECPGLVARAMRLLWASRAGLREAELLDLLGEDGRPLPAAYWFPIANAADRALMARSGRVGFAHAYLRQAVENRFASTLTEQRAAHLVLADYFAALPPSKDDDARLAARAATGVQWSERFAGNEGAVDRHTFEYPWQLEKAGEWERLAQWLARVPDALFALLRARSDYLHYWTVVEKSSPLRAVQAFDNVIRHPDRHPESIALVCHVLQALGHHAELTALAEYVVRHWDPGRRVDYEWALFQYTNALVASGGLAQARQVCAEVKPILEARGLRSQYAHLLNLESSLCRRQQELDEAASLSAEALTLFTELGEPGGAREARLALVSISIAEGKYEPALALLHEIAADARAAEDYVGTTSILASIADVLEKLGREKESAATYAEAEQIFQTLGEDDLLGAFYSNRATSSHEKGRHKEALEWYAKAEGLAANNMPILSHVWQNMAMLLMEQGESERALQLADKAQDFFRRNNHLDLLAQATGGRALLLWQMGRMEEAEAAFAEATGTAQRAHAPEALLRQVANYALFVLQQNRPVDDILRVFEEAHTLMQQGFTSYRERLTKIATLVADRLALNVIADAIGSGDGGDDVAVLHRFCDQWRLPNAGVYTSVCSAVSVFRADPQEALRLLEAAAKQLPSAFGRDDEHFQLRRVLIYLADHIGIPNDVNPFDPANQMVLECKESALRALGAKEELVRVLCGKATLYLMLVRVLPEDLPPDQRGALVAAGISADVTMHQLRVGQLHEALGIVDEAAKLAEVHDLDEQRDAVRQCHLAVADTAEVLASRLVDDERLEEACQLAAIAAHAVRKTDDAERIADAFARQALLLHLTGETERAVLVGREAADRARQAGRVDLLELLTPLLEN